MKNRVIVLVGFIYSILIGIILLNIYSKYAYDINFIEYIEKSRKITYEEKNWLNENKNIIYISDQNSYPLAFKSQEGQYKGVLVDFMNALSIEIGKDIIFEVNDGWQNYINKSSVDEIKCFGLIPSKEREEYFVFSDPIYIIRGNIVKPKRLRRIKSYKDLKGYKVAVPKSNYAVEFLKENLNEVEFVFTKDLEDTINALEEGRADVAIGDEPVLKYYMENKGMNKKYEFLKECVYKKPVVISIPKQKRELLNIINKGIFSLRKNDMFKSVKTKWYSEDLALLDENKNDNMVRFVFIFIYALFIMIYIFFTLNYTLKKQIKIKTKELSDSRNSLRNTLDSITDVVIVLDKNNDILHANRAFNKFIENNNVDLNVNQWIFKDIINNTFKEKAENSKEYFLKEKILKINTFPFDDSDNILESIVIVIKDITKEKVAEREIIQDNKMIAIGQLASGVAHEIRNPLGIIRNYCYLLKSSIQDEESLEFIGAIENNIERASKIISNLLNFARISTNAKNNLKIKGFLEDIMLLEDKTLRNNNIKVSIDCDDNITFYINEEVLRHIFINLISNSIDAINENKKNIYEGEIRISVIKKDKTLSIDISDNGCGIDEDDMIKIFNPFYTTKPIGKGTGLGLYITYNEIKRNNGNIKINSKKCVGTTFKLEFKN
ncbi:ATP-binding protein [Clostridium ihumii]|uniref:ATP-binding protein n=1 Tax=Clostridium ihumii TaxID=1470356 RepID=UPI00058CC015|nr:transporter substrate-binding domain-containing protein [Clostridium ihumii]